MTTAKDIGNEAVDLAALRQEAAQARGSTAATERVFRRLAKREGAKGLRVAWLGNHTLDPLLRQATVAAFANGVDLQNHAGDFDQYFQALLDPRSTLNAFGAQAMVLSLSMRALSPALASGGAGLGEAVRREEADRVLQHVTDWVDAARERSDATLLVSNFVRPARPGLGLADTGQGAGDSALYAWLNEELRSRWAGDPQVQILDVDHAIGNAGRLVSWNPRMYHLAKIEWDGPGLAAAGELLARTLCALARPAKKCLLLDIDNTLWGGVVGEDGVDGLRIGNGDPVGEAFTAFQRAILDIKARGVLLAAVSKNNPADVEEAFERLDMPLALDDFAITRINWEHKHLNIGEIAAELNIGIDSTVFVDDNPAERELIRQMLPDVEVVDLPDDPAEYADLLLSSWHFDKLALTEEDASKTRQYRDNAARSKSRADATDLESYLMSLGTRVEIGVAAEAQLARLHQLFTKTNQFNVTTRRHSLAELKHFLESDEWLFEWVRVRDNFGDLGIVGTYLVRLGETPEIDSFILSCRAMGREIETAACNRIKEKVFGSGASSLKARFLPTAKNKPVVEFYEKQGFEVTQRGADGDKTYVIAAANATPRPCPMLEITINGGS